MDSNTSLLLTVPFSNIQQWDVKQFFLTRIKSKYVVEELEKHLVHQTEKIQNPYRVNVGSIGIKTPDLRGGELKMGRRQKYYDLYLKKIFLIFRLEY